MKLLSRLAAVAALALATINPIYAQDRGTADEARALAEKALAHIKTAGADKAYEEFSTRDGKWQNKDLYVFVVKFDGVTVAHGANKALVGKNMLELKDPTGKPFMKDMIDTAKGKGSGWVDYMFTDPATKKTMAKSSYVARVPGADAFVGVGIYK